MNAEFPVPSAHSTSLASWSASDNQPDTSNGQPRHWLRPQLAIAPKIAFAADRLAAAGGYVCLVWDTLSHTKVARIVESAPIHCLALSQDGERLVLGVDQSVRVYRVSTGALSFEYHHAAAICSVHVAARTALLASADVEGCLQVRHLNGGKQRMQNARQPGNWVVFLEKDGDVLVAESSIESMFLDMDTGEVLRRFTLNDSMPSNGPSCCLGAQLICFHGEQVHIFDTADPRSGCFKIIRFGSPVTSIDISEDDSVFLVTTQREGVHIYTMRTATEIANYSYFANPTLNAKFGRRRDFYVTGEEAAVLHIRNGRYARTYCEVAPIVAAALDPHRSNLLVTDRTGGVTNYDLTTGRRSGRFSRHVGSVSTVVCGARYVASGGYDGVCRLSEWNGELVAEYQVGTTSVQAIAIDEQCHRLWVGMFHGPITCFDIATQQPLETFDNHKLSVRSLSLSPDGRFLASGDEDGLLCVRDLRMQGEIVKSLRQNGFIYRAVFDGDTILATSEAGVQRHSLESQLPVASYGTNVVRWFCILDNGQLCTLGISGELCLYDMATAACTHRAQIADPRFHRAVLSLSPNRIITGSADGLLRVFDYQLNLVALAHHLDWGVLWMTESAESHPGWLSTDRPELLEVGQVKDGCREPLPTGDPRRGAHFTVFNSASHVMAVVAGRDTIQPPPFRNEPGRATFALNAPQLGLWNNV